MSTIRSTYNNEIGYTVVGDAPARSEDKPALVLLNRSPRMLRTEYIAALADAGYGEIVSVEYKEHAYSVESLSSEFPGIRFVLLDDRIDVGTHIAIAFSLIKADIVLVLWSTIAPPQGVERAIKRLKAETAVCVAPLLRTDRGETLPVQVVPALRRRSLRVLRIPVRGEDARTLFPSDYVGLYHRTRFFECGGFDRSIETPYWQLTDFGFRSYLWGYEIPIASGFRASYRSLPEPVDETVKVGYARFYARNLAPRTTSEGLAVPPFAAIPFAIRSGLGLIRTARIFMDAGKWVVAHRDRFKMDARTLIERWSVEHD